MAQETAAQKKARLATEKQAQQSETVAPDLLKFVNPGAAAAAVETATQDAQDGDSAEDSATSQDTTPALSEATAVATGDTEESETPAPVAVTQEVTVSKTSSYEVIVDSIGLGTAQVALRGEVLELEHSLAQRLLSLKGIRPA